MMARAEKVLAHAAGLGLIVDVLSSTTGFSFKIRSRMHPGYNAHGVHYLSRNQHYSTENGIRLHEDQVLAYLSAYAADPCAGPWLLMERCGIDPFSNWKLFDAS
jgi:hypothetical protein